MKRLFSLIMAVSFLCILGNLSFAAKNPLRANEKKFNAEMASLIPKDHVLKAPEFYKVWQAVLAGKKKAYLLDVRTDSEFEAMHIEGTDHIQAGHWYVIPKKIKDPNAEIYVFCRTHHRGRYVAGFLYKIGYKNVYLYDGGIVGWAKAGYPLVNAFTGEFKIKKYRQRPSKKEKSYRLRMWNSFK